MVKKLKKCSLSFYCKGGKNAVVQHYIMLLKKSWWREDYKYSKALAAYDKNWTFEERRILINQLNG